MTITATAKTKLEEDLVMATLKMLLSEKLITSAELEEILEEYKKMS